ncbi:hypothetical protein cyc_05492 [Cyclospora cayetanensis]|uniref:Uncharacterized protein n=1 Tax=Cyclospora cayetanensis TaxID=88456 RepID=A0A1D3D2M5_9EIME|nr:hypothetical protein cyc_05492 [Cyclospora cayetanensis]
MAALVEDSSPRKKSYCAWTWSNYALGAIRQSRRNCGAPYRGSVSHSLYCPPLEGMVVPGGYRMLVAEVLPVALQVANLGDRIRRWTTLDDTVGTEPAERKFSGAAEGWQNAFHELFQALMLTRGASCESGRTSKLPLHMSLPGEPISAGAPDIFAPIEIIGIVTYGQMAYRTLELVGMAATRRVERLMACGGWALPAVKTLAIHLKGEAASHKLYSEFSKGFLPGLRLANPSVEFVVFEGAPTNALSMTLDREGPPVMLNLDLYRQPHQLVQRILDLQAIVQAVP